MQHFILSLSTYKIEQKPLFEICSSTRPTLRITAALYLTLIAFCWCLFIFKQAEAAALFLPPRPLNITRRVLNIHVSSHAQCSYSTQTKLHYLSIEKQVKNTQNYQKLTHQRKKSCLFT